MKKFLLFILLTLLNTQLFAANLIQVFQQALVSDQIYQQAISQRLSDQQNVPINVSYLLPSAFVNATPGSSTAGYSGPAYGPASTVGKRGYDMNLTVTQTIFDYGKISGVRSAYAFSKQADATFNAAIQSLIIRVSRAYFDILLDEDNLRYIGATKEAYAKELDQITQEYKVGIKTITDVYTAQASYDSSVANYIFSETKLKNDRENLRVITGILYTNISKLSERFPLVSPCPSNIDIWANLALHQNWNIKSAQFAVDVARHVVQQQFAGHLPTLNLQGVYDTNYYAFSGDSLISFPGGGRVTTKSVNLSVVFPVFEGGYVTATTRQAQYNHCVVAEKLQQTIRDSLNLARQSYMNVIAGIAQVNADKLTIKSTQSSYEGLSAGYRVGTQTLVDVLNQQQKVFEAQKRYSTDRYNYVINFLTLKQAAGTLSPGDLIAINGWLIDNPEYSELTNCQVFNGSKKQHTDTTA